jgi:two-component system response regulator YesN
MIVDDERLIRQGLRKVIPWEDLGFKVIVEASSGKTALEAAINKGKEPQVILTDIKMPDMSGLELIARLRLHFPNLRSVVISGYSDFNYAVEALKLKVEDYILKPIDPEAIKEIFLRLHRVLDGEWMREPITNTRHADLGVLIDSLGDSLERGNDIKAFAFSIIRETKMTVSDPSSYYQQILGELAIRFRIKDFIPAPRAGDTLPETVFLQNLKELTIRVREQGAAMGKLLAIRMKRETEAHYGENDFSLRKLANLFNMSYGYLSTVFSKYEHIGFSAYLRRCRMKKARELLLSRDFRIYEIALQVGYGNTHYFSDAFRREYGLSPREYIARMGGKKNGSYTC